MAKRAGNFVPESHFYVDGNGRFGKAFALNTNFRVNISDFTSKE